MTLKKFTFNVENNDHLARTGIISTHRGDIRTPAFMPVGTQATVKATFMDDIKETGSDVILGNTYHLMIRPGVDRVVSAGGLHKFMNWPYPILTDSGGFQVMSLSKLTKIDREKGAIFNSHIDGKEFVLSPEESIKIQKGLNSDILMVLDECPKKTVDKNIIKKSFYYINSFINTDSFCIQYIIRSFIINHMNNIFTIFFFKFYRIIGCYRLVSFPIIINN